MKKNLIVTLDAYSDFINDLTKNTNYMVFVSSLDDIASIKYFTVRVKDEFSTRLDCMLYNRENGKTYCGMFYYDEYDGVVRVYIKE